jgi:serine/threonine-protein kinase
MSEVSNILFDKFEITETLKKDQHSTVYLANHIYLGKKIILKTLASDELSDKTFLNRFKREAKIIAQLDHTNIIKVLDFGTAANSFYISFEYFESRNLRKVIKDNNLSDDDKVDLCIQLFKALDAAHQKGIIHRDIKPENILVNSNLELKIADFGLALARDENILTQKSSIVGTPGYMSPEQIRGEELTPQTDLFSSGIVIYELFTGENSLIGNDISETINNILNFKIERDFKKFSSLPAEIQNVLQELLRKKFSKRTKTALDALTYFKAHGKLKDELFIQPEKERSKRKYFYWTISMIIVAIAEILFILYLIYFNSSSNTISLNQKNTPLILEQNDSLKELASNEKIKIDPVDSEIVTLPEEISSKKINESFIATSDGKLFVEVSPWADVFINNQKIGTTPLDEKIELKPGKYELKLIHPDFPNYSDSIEILPGELRTVKVNFYEEVGYLDCKIFPWGEVFIDGTYKNTTPFRKPMLLMPGEYYVKIVNPGYRENIEEVVTIKSKETVVLKYNFDELAKSQ